MSTNTPRLTLAISACVALVLSSGVQAQQARDQAARPRPAGTAALSGIVVTNEQTPLPIRRAMVTAASADGGGTRMTFTDEAGRFSIGGLSAGRYTLTANKAPLLRTSYGARRADGPGTPITLKDAHQMTDIVLRMTRGAVLSGRILDENGEPAFGVSVRVLQMRMQFGERTFVPVAGSGLMMDTTDDRGAYRFFGLPPGEYAVAASPRLTPGEVRAMTESEIRAIMQALQQQAAQAPAQTGQAYGQTPPPANPMQSGAPGSTPQTAEDKVTVAYAPVYYPGTTVASSASTVTVGAGDERTGVDFSLRLVRTTTVEGMVITPAGVSPQSVQLTMMPTSTATGAGGLEMLSLQRAAIGADGKFTYTAVPPGQYTISARATTGAPGPPPPPPPPPPGMTSGTVTFTSRAAPVEAPMIVMPEMSSDPNAMQYWASVEVPVDGAPVSGVTLSLAPGMTIAGKVEFRSAVTRPGGDFRRVRLQLIPVATPGGNRVNLGTTSFRMEDNGQFQIGGVTPGRYRLTGAAPLAPGSGPGAPWTLASAVAKDRDLLDFPLDVVPGENIDGLVVTFTDAKQEVNGSLLDASGRPAPDYTIVVFAADNRYWTAQSRRIRTARPGTDGRFSVTNLPPGDYRMAAVVDLAPNEANDPAFLEQLVGSSFTFTLGVGEKKTQDLKIAGGL